MAIHLEPRNLINAQQMEVAVNGPDGATHLILCTGAVDLGSVSHETCTFFVGPPLSRRQFIGAIASGALARIRAYDRHPTRDSADLELDANLVLIDASYDDEASQVKVRAEISSQAISKLAISYHVSILAELPTY